MEWSALTRKEVQPGLGSRISADANDVSFIAPLGTSRQRRWDTPVWLRTSNTGPAGRA